MSIEKPITLAIQWMVIHLINYERYPPFTEKLARMKIYKKIPLGLLRWFLKASFSTFWVKFGNTIQKFRFSFDPIQATENNVPSEKKLFTCNFHRKLPSNFLTTLISSIHFLGGDRRNLTPGQITNELNRSGDELQTISNTTLI